MAEVLTRNVTAKPEVVGVAGRGERRQGVVLQDTARRRIEVVTPISLELVKEAQKEGTGGLKALTEVMSLSGPKVMDFITAHSRLSREDREDLTQQVLLKVVKNIKTFKAQGKTFESWLFAIARDTTRDLFDARRARVATTNTDVEQAAISKGLVENDFSDEVISTDARAKLLAKLSGLTVEQQEVLIMKMQGLRPIDIARRTNRSKAAATQLIQRAEAKAQQVLGDERPVRAINRRKTRHNKNQPGQPAESPQNPTTSNEMLLVQKDRLSIPIEDLEVYLSSQVAQAEKNLEQYSDDFHRGILKRLIDRELAFRRLNQTGKPGSDEFIIRTIFAPELDQMAELRKVAQAAGSQVPDEKSA